jgi:glycosyltransferase involved in cell wall biosynthesis
MTPEFAGGVASAPRPMRVTTLVDRLGTRGGAERLALETVKRLDPNEFARTLCVSRWSQDEARDEAAQAALAELGAAGVRFLPLWRRRKVDVWVWRRLLKHLRTDHVHVLHAHKFGSNIWGTALGRAGRVPVVIAHEHTWSYVGNPLRRLLDRELIARGASTFIAVSRDDQRKMIEVEGIRPERTTFIPNGIPAPPPPSGKDVRGELGLDADAPLIGSVGFLRPQKAFDVLVEAAAVLAREFPQVRVLIVGDGEQREQLEQLARAFGVERQVVLTGRRLDVPDILATLDVAVCCSDYEGSPLSVMEYMAAGLPVVATRVGGVPDLIDDGVEGLVVERRAPEALADAIARLLRDPALARELGDHGRDRRAREFDIDVMVRRLEELYRSLYVGRNGATRK